MPRSPKRRASEARARCGSRGAIAVSRMMPFSRSRGSDASAGLPLLPSPPRCFGATASGGRLREVPAGRAGTIQCNGASATSGQPIARISFPRLTLQEAPFMSRPVRAVFLHSPNHLLASVTRGPSLCARKRLGPPYPLADKGQYQSAEKAMLVMGNLRDCSKSPGHVRLKPQGRQTCAHSAIITKAT